MEKEVRDIFAEMEEKDLKIKDLITYNIMLIGFMGAGKSTVSSYLSKKLNMEEVDTDALIVKKEGKKIPQIFGDNGENYFRDCESNILIDLQKRQRLIISCGGGIVLRDENIQHMKKQGRVVLLTATPQTTYERVKDSKERPILNDNMNTEFIAQLMEKRQDKYQAAADIIIATDHKNVAQICNEIIEELISLEVKNK